MSNPDSPDIDRLNERANELAKAGANEGLAKMASGGASQKGPARIDLTNVREAFTYQSWSPSQVGAGREVTEALIAAAETILRVVPESPLRTRAINGLFDARMIANAAITHWGKF